MSSIGSCIFAMTALSKKELKRQSAALDAKDWSEHLIAIDGFRLENAELLSKSPIHALAADALESRVLLTRRRVLVVLTELATTGETSTIDVGPLLQIIGKAWQSSELKYGKFPNELPQAPADNGKAALQEVAKLLLPWLRGEKSAKPSSANAADAKSDPGDSKADAGDSKPADTKSDFSTVKAKFIKKMDSLPRAELGETYHLLEFQHFIFRAHKPITPFRAYQVSLGNLQNPHKCRGEVAFPTQPDATAVLRFLTKNLSEVPTAISFPRRELTTALGAVLEDAGIIAFTSAVVVPAVFLEGVRNVNMLGPEGDWRIRTKSLATVPGITLNFVRHIFEAAANYARFQPHLYNTIALDVEVAGYKWRSAAVMGNAGIQFGLALNGKPGTAIAVRLVPRNGLCAADDDMIQQRKLEIANDESYPQIAWDVFGEPQVERLSMSYLRWFSAALQALPIFMRERRMMDYHACADKSRWRDETIKVGAWSPKTDAVDAKISVRIMFPSADTRATVEAQLAAAGNTLSAALPFERAFGKPAFSKLLRSVQLLEQFPELRDEFLGYHVEHFSPGCYTDFYSLTFPEAQAAVFCKFMFRHGRFADLWDVATKQLALAADATSHSTKTCSRTVWAWTLALLAFFRCHPEAKANVNVLQLTVKSAGDAGDAKSAGDAADAKTGSAGDAKTDFAVVPKLAPLSKEEAAAFVKSARRANPRVLPFLYKADRLPTREQANMDEPSVESKLRADLLLWQAVNYCQNNLPSWARSPGAVEWVSEALNCPLLSPPPKSHTLTKKNEGQCARENCFNCPFKKCTGCESIWYCSALCQMADWPAHRAKCKQSTASPAAKADKKAKSKS